MKVKDPDLTAADLEAALRTIAGLLGRWVLRRRSSNG